MSHKPEDLIALPLSVGALYELFSNDYTIYHHDGAPITSFDGAEKSQKETIGCSFDIQKIDTICKRQHLEPACSMKFVNRFTIQWLGYKWIPSLDTEASSPTDTEQKQEKRLTDSEKKKLQNEIDILKTEVNDLRKKLKPVNEKHAAGVKERMACRVNHNNIWKTIKDLFGVSAASHQEQFDTKEKQWDALKNSKKKADE